MNAALKMMMNRLQSQRPREFKMVSELMRNNGDPSKLLQQVMSNIDPQQKQNILSQARYLGAPEGLLSQLQNDNN
jgi:hypothetical protein